jgi:ABC-type transport system involved in multi-copper enzyme maturation permease subunit
MAETATMPSRRDDVRLQRAPSFVGPLFFYDLVRLARRGRTFILRCVYALLLLIALRIAYGSRFPHHDLRTSFFASPTSLSVNAMARLAEAFVFSILTVQTAAIFVLTPAYVAGAIASEKERKTLELLFTTHLSNREIVLGTLAARLMHLGGILLTGLPLLALTQLWGGVDFRILLAAFVVSGLNLLSVGAISIWSSVICRTTTQALCTAYAATVGILILFLCLTATPAGVFSHLASAVMARTTSAASLSPDALVLGQVVACTVENGIVIVIGLICAVKLLRKSAGIPAESGPARAEYAPMPAQQPIEATYRSFQLVRSLPYLPPIGDWPLLWKETYRSDQEGSTREFERLLREKPLMMSGFALFVLEALYFFSTWREGEFVELKNAMSVLEQFALILTASLWCGVVAFRAAVGISRERDGQTLGTLLTLPMSRSEILGAKWLGPVLYSRGFGYLLIALILIGLASGTLHPLGALILVAAIAIHVAFLASIGLWLSVASRTTLQARFLTALVLLVFLGGGLRQLSAHSPITVTQRAGLFPDWSELPWQILVAEVGANAPGAWSFLSFSQQDFHGVRPEYVRQFIGRLLVTIGGMAVYAAAAAAFWLAACRRFRRETPQ